MDMLSYAALGLSFVAVASVTGFLFKLMFSLSEAKRKPLSEAEKVENPLYRFIAPDHLFRLTFCAGAGTGGLLLAGLGFLGASWWVCLLSALAAGWAGSLVPRAWFEHRVRKRRELFDRRLMDLTLGLANGLRAGSNLTQSMETVARDLGGPIAEEFGYLLHEHRFGKDMAGCLEHLACRMPSEELTLLTTSIRISLQTGGSLAEMMDRISDTIRFRLDFKERVKTMTTQGRFEAMAMGSAPLVVMVILYFVNREMIMPLFTTRTGLWGLASVAVLETLGFFFINKIVKIEV